MLNPFDRDILKGVASNIYFWLASVGVSALVALVSAGSAGRQGLPFYQVAGIGAVIFLLLIAALSLVGMLVTRFLHQIAEQHAYSIDRWVGVDLCGFQLHELLRDEPYVEFIFYVYNNSVYNVRLDKDSLAGSVFFAKRQLNGKLRWSEHPEEILEGCRDLFVIQQSLSKEDAGYILSSTGDGARFDFRRLEIKIKGARQFETKLAPRRLNIYDQTLRNDDLLQAYRGQLL